MNVDRNAAPLLLRGRNQAFHELHSLPVDPAEPSSGGLELSRPVRHLLLEGLRERGELFVRLAESSVCHLERAERFEEQPG